MQRIIFFLADELATDSEKQSIIKLNKLAETNYVIHVRNSRVPNVHGSLEEGDLVAGTIPERYTSNLTINPDSLPITLSLNEPVLIYSSDGTKSESITLSKTENDKVKGSLPATSTIIKNNEAVMINNGINETVTGSHRVIVGNGAVKSVKLDSLIATVKDGDFGPIMSYDGAIALTTGTKIKVSGSKVSGVILADNAAILRNGDSMTLTDYNGVSLGNVVASVSKNVMNSPKLASAIAAVRQGDTVNLLSATGTNILQGLSLNIADGKIAGVVTPATSAIVKSSDSIAVQDSNGVSAGNGVATVAANAISQIKLDSSRAVINPGNSVPVQNSAGTAVENAAVTIAAGKATVKLSAGVAPVKNGAVLSLPVVVSSLLAIGTATKSVTLKVENGVITGLTI